MKRLLLIVFNAVATLSLLLCTAAVERWRDQARLGSGEAVTAETTPAPTFSVSMSRKSTRWVIESGDSGRSWDGIVGFGSGERRYVGSGAMSTLRYVVMPHWAIAAGLAVLALPARRAWFSRRLSGGCPRCGYDLRATPDQCPECGLVAKP